MRGVSVVTCFLLRRGPPDEVLLLRRSDRVGTYRGRWAGVSGHLETESPLEQAYRELDEEVSLGREDVRLLVQDEPVVIEDHEIDTRWTVYLFLFEALKPDRVRLDWEHTESRWVRPEEVRDMETVPGLAEGLARVYRAP